MEGPSSPWFYVASMGLLNNEFSNIPESPQNLFPATFFCGRNSERWNILALYDLCYWVTLEPGRPAQQSGPTQGGGLPGLVVLPGWGRS